MASAGFTDPGILDTHTALWAWGDETSPGSVTEVNGCGTVSGTHTYLKPGVYTVTLTVTDDDGASSQRVYGYVVIYDPSAGFVTGGGWILSPAGAYVPDPGADRDGQLRLRHQVPEGCHGADRRDRVRVPGRGHMNFQSTSYQWLVVSGKDKAQYKGSGTINGSAATTASC